MNIILFGVSSAMEQTALLRSEIFNQHFSGLSEKGYLNWEEESLDDFSESFDSKVQLKNGLKVKRCGKEFLQIIDC